MLLVLVYDGHFLSTVFIKAVIVNLLDALVFMRFLETIGYRLIVPDTGRIEEEAQQTIRKWSNLFITDKFTGRWTAYSDFLLFMKVDEGAR